jgi:short-subunit dehydrogenase
MAQKRALVTGASEGIGRVLAARLARDGYQVTAVARSADKLAALIGELGSGHGSLVADLSDPDGVARVARELEQNKYDLLVNNAGAGVFGPFAQAELAQLARMMHLNCDALVTLTHVFLARAQSGDAVMNVASTLGFLGLPNFALYAATKALVLSLSESLWFEQKPRGVYVMALCPGVTSTSFHANAGGTDATKPPERIAQTPEQVVDEAMVALAARKQPSVVTGFKNRAMVFTSRRVMTRKRTISMMGSFATER